MVPSSVSRTFDAVLAVFVLNHARNGQDLDRLVAKLSDRIEPAGLLVAVVGALREADHAFISGGPNFTKYRLTIHAPDGLREGARLTLEPQADPPPFFEITQWSEETYREASSKAGLADCTSLPLAPSAEAVERFSLELWADLDAHPYGFVLSARRITPHCDR
jgi:hypothetical protein